MIFIAFLLGQLAYGQLDIAAELLRETLQLQFFSLFGGIAEVFLKTRFGSIDCLFYVSEFDLHFFVAALGVIGPIDRQHLIAFLITQSQQLLNLVELVSILTHVQKDAAVAVGDDALLEDGRRQQVVQLLRYAHTLAEILAAGFIQILDKSRHARLGDSFPCFFEQ